MDNAAVFMNEVFKRKILQAQKEENFTAAAPSENGRSVAARYQWEG